MTDIEVRTRSYLRALHSPEGPSVEIARVVGLEQILSFARSKGWITEDPEFGGHSLSSRGIQEVIR